MTARREFLFRSLAYTAGALLAPRSLLASTGSAQSTGAAGFEVLLDRPFLIFSDGFARYDIAYLRELRAPTSAQAGVEQFTLVFRRDGAARSGAALPEGLYHAYCASGEQYELFIQPMDGDDVTGAAYRAEFSLLR